MVYTWRMGKGGVVGIRFLHDVYLIMEFLDSKDSETDFAQGIKMNDFLVIV